MPDIVPETPPRFTRDPLAAALTEDRVVASAIRGPGGDGGGRPAVSVTPPPVIGRRESLIEDDWRRNGLYRRRSRAVAEDGGPRA
ncbi:MAG: hypothetical protein R3C99_11825 [Pirellulaceae bacterium]